MNKFMTATEVRKNFYTVIDEAGRPGLAVAITHEGMPKVVVMSFEEYESWQETLEIMSDPEMVKDLREAREQIKAGKLHTNAIGLDEVKRRLKAQRKGHTKKKSIKRHV